MVEDAMMLVWMMYRLIQDQDCDKMELNSHLLLLCDCIATEGATAAERQWRDSGAIAVRLRSNSRSDSSGATVEQ